MTNELTTTDRRTMLGLTALTAGAAMMASASPAIAADDKKTMPKAGLTPDQALAKLIEGNKRFVADNAPIADITTKRRLEIARGQAPFAALVGCADSRVGPEHLFGAGLGELFIVRTAGNYVDDAGYGSLAYGVAALGIPLIVVLGHERCGAVDAATKLVTNNSQLPPSLNRMVQPILPAVIDARATLGNKVDLVDHAIHMNVRHVVRGLRGTSDPIIAEPIKAGKVRVVGAYYDLDTGAVDFIDLG